MGSKMFLSRLSPPECDCCGDTESFRTDNEGRIICIACGLHSTHGSAISDRPTFVEHESAIPVLSNNFSDSCPLIEKIQTRHPACLDTAKRLVDRCDQPVSKHVHAGDHIRMAQALAYIAYRIAEQAVTRVELASQCDVPVERLSKDIKKLSQRLGIVTLAPVLAREIEGEDPEEMPEDLKALKSALISQLNKSFLKIKVSVRCINEWCSDLFLLALDAKDTAVINIAPRLQAAALLSLYCQHVQCPFNDEFVSGLPCKRDRQGNIDTVQAVCTHLTKNVGAKRAAQALACFLTAGS